MELRLDAVVWGIFDQRTVAIATQDRTERIAAETLVLAPGAYDRPVPFPGWTLPGVITAGGAQNLMKGYGRAARPACPHRGQRAAPARGGALPS